MVATAAHLTDQVLPPLPVRQWALTVPKRLRYFLQHDADLQGAALRLFLRVVEQCLRAPALASVPARNQHDKLAEQPVAAASHRLTRTTDLTSIRLARLKSLSVIADLSCGFEFETPIQCAPDLVRHLMGKNIAIYQLVRIARGKGSWRQ
jgi:hypothetical protein